MTRPSQPSNQQPAPAPPQSGGQPPLSEKLEGVVVELRSELDISRHVFRQGPAYVVRDPITFATHRFDPGDYAILRAIRPETPLGETFEHLVGTGELDREDQDAFYTFILDLHQRSLLTLPINNADALFQRFERKRRAERLSKLLGVLFLRVPLINPDRFLSSTISIFRWLYTTPALILWVLLMAAAGFVALSRADELTAPVLAVIEGNNLFMLWGALIGLKVVHEFGHAYACKSFGGHVPEMGAFFILFTPVAYVDATDSWTFPKARERAIVTLGGVYFESIIGAAAVFVWAMTEPSAINTLAYQIIILATVTTIAFNMNPLLRYDAYYLVSDMVAIPNLRARCQEALADLCKRVLFGLKYDADGEPHTFKPGLALFGAAQITYRTLMMVTISTVLIMKFGMPGIGIALFIVGMTLLKAVRSLVGYVFSSEETSGVRTRAALTTFGAAAALIAAAVAVPLPWPITVNGIVTFQSVEPVRAPVDGAIAGLPAEPGTDHQPGDTLALLISHNTTNRLEGLHTDRLTADARVINAALKSPLEALQSATDRRRLDAQIARLQHDADALDLTAPTVGRVLDTLESKPGAAVKQGDPVLIYASGEPEAVFFVRAFEFDALRIAVGDTITGRSPAFPEREITGEIVHIAHAGTREIEQRISLVAPAGLVPINPQTGRSLEPYFEIRVRLNPRDAAIAGIGIQARIDAEHRTTASVIKRRLIRFLNRIKAGADG